ncbi:hypothetical protein ACQHIV_28440 [Kribbella sp. GL6]|uniref:hypothetical protein n=1 Tax=Kribbella sp. GL6 TaxID=3419765 RepID=UPI003CFF3B32
MGSSFTDFRGYGFWARDGLLEVWLEVLAEVVPADAPRWLRDAERHWRLHARAGFQGCVDADLDSRLISDDRVETLLALMDQAYEHVFRVAGETGHVPAAWLNDRGVGGEGVVWTCDLELGSVRRIADAFVALLTGELETTAATSRVLQ